MAVGAMSFMSMRAPGPVMSMRASGSVMSMTAMGPPVERATSTFAPSASVRKPSPAIPEKCTKASFPPSSGVMNPKPFSSLNHFTTPVAINNTSSL